MSLQHNYIFPFTEQTLERSLSQLDDLPLFMCSGTTKNHSTIPSSVYLED